MPFSLELKIYCAALPSSDYETLRTLNRWQPGVVDFGTLEGAIKETVFDRLGFAHQMLTFAEGLQATVKGPDDSFVARNVLSRAYYCLHHTLRALSVYERRNDPFGHEATIEQAVRIFAGVRALSAKLGRDASRLGLELSQAREQRNLADYHFLGTDSEKYAPLDFVMAAGNVITLARAVYDTVN